MPEDKTKQRFDQLLQVMASQPEPLGRQQGDNRTSGKGRVAGYGDTRTREGKSQGTSSKRKYKSR
jgi:hypothetical protein